MMEGPYSQRAMFRHNNFGPKASRVVFFSLIQGQDDNSLFKGALIVI